MKKVYLILILLTLNTYAKDSFPKDYSIYFFGIVKHFEPTPRTNEGDMKYLAISKWESYDYFNTEVGFGSYIDSYNIRAYMLFANFTNDSFEYGIFKPMVGALLQSKGTEYASSKRKVVLTPSLKLRVGQNDGLFMNAMAVPKISNLTNGFYSFEFGYKF